ncbi:MAG TPA: B-box zinc finger protein [Thermoanaerobaculia bacterium]|nr:B-box zinc finger protein [Thermoanaerobaculia bacterium]
MSEMCVQHPNVAAMFRCDGCGKVLCGECIRKGHALLFCTLCGERALPLAEGQPATVQQVRRHEAVTKPYSFTDALAYPFRGSGLLMFIVAVASMMLIQVMLTFGIGLWRYFFAAGFWSLMIGLQFSIVRTTAEGQDELPEWPDYSDFGERLADILTYVGIALLQFGPAGLYLFLRWKTLVAGEPGVFFWVVFALLAWLGAALATMAYGAAGRFTRPSILRLDLHTKGFVTGGADAVTAANLTFGLGAAFFVLRLAFSAIPILGAILSGIVGAYWFFTSAHIAGVLFRRHIFRLEKLYE